MVGVTGTVFQKSLNTMVRLMKTFKKQKRESCSGHLTKSLSLIGDRLSLTSFSEPLQKPSPQMCF